MLTKPVEGDRLRGERTTRMFAIALPRVRGKKGTKKKKLEHSAKNRRNKLASCVPCPSEVLFPKETKKCRGGGVTFPAQNRHSGP